MHLSTGPGTALCTSAQLAIDADLKQAVGQVFERGAEGFRAVCQGAREAAVGFRVAKRQGGREQAPVRSATRRAMTSVAR